MALDNQVIMLAATMVLNYLLVYRRIPLLGAFLFIIIGIGTFWVTIEQPWGFLIITIGLISFLYALAYPPRR